MTTAAERLSDHLSRMSHYDFARALLEDKFFLASYLLTILLAFGQQYPPSEKPRRLVLEKENPNIMLDPAADEHMLMYSEWQWSDALAVILCVCTMRDYPYTLGSNGRFRRNKHTYDFEKTVNQLGIEIVQLLMISEQFRNLREALEALSYGQRNSISIIGQVGAGKTTLIRAMNLLACNYAVGLRVIREEPDQTAMEHYDPDYEYPYEIFQLMLEHEHGRKATRGDEATLGSDTARIYFAQHSSHNPSEIFRIGAFDITSYGGHLKAAKGDTNQADLVVALFDPRVLEEIACLDPHVTINTKLSNGETVVENLVSLIHLMFLLSTAKSDVIGVFSKCHASNDVDVMCNRLMQAYRIALQIFTTRHEVFTEELCWIADFRRDDIELPTLAQARKILFDLEDWMGHSQNHTLSSQAQRVVLTELGEPLPPNSSFKFVNDIQWHIISDKRTEAGGAVFGGSTAVLGAITRHANNYATPIAFAEKPAQGFVSIRDCMRLIQDGVHYPIFPDSNGVIPTGLLRSE